MSSEWKCDFSRQHPKATEYKPTYLPTGASWPDHRAAQDAVLPPSCPPLPEQLPSGSGLAETWGSKEAAQATRTTARAFASEVSSSSDFGPVFGSAAHQLFGFCCAFLSWWIDWKIWLWSWCSKTGRGGMQGREVRISIQPGRWSGVQHAKSFKDNANTIFRQYFCKPPCYILLNLWGEGEILKKVKIVHSLGVGGSAVFSSSSLPFIIDFTSL